MLAACIVAFWALGTCLAAGGAWDSNWHQAYKWTGMAYWFTFISCIFTAVEVSKLVDRRFQGGGLWGVLNSISSGSTSRSTCSSLKLLSGFKLPDRR